MEVQPQTNELKGWLKAQNSFAREQLDALLRRLELKAALGVYLANADMAFLQAVAGDPLHHAHS